MVRNFQSTEPQFDDPRFTELPVDMPVAVYYRQSTSVQIGNISTDMQQIDLVEEMKRRGWSDENIIPINADAGVSGTTRIDERVGMSQLYDLITTGKIGAVATQDEDRLFRDVTMIQPNIFIDACLKNRVQVVTPAIVYIFHHPTMGQFYMKQFRFKCEMAAEYLNFLKSRLHGARNWLRRHGKFSGGRVPTGYMVVADENSPDYRRFVPWPEIAALVKRVFEVFVEVNGHSPRAARRLVELGICFPDFATTLPPEGYSYAYQGGSKTGYLSPQAIRAMVTNPVYIGHWMYRGAIVIWNNHEPIIDEPLFFEAFNYVSKFNLDGSVNHNYRPRGRKYMPQPRRKDIDYPLLKGLLHVKYENKWHRMGLEYSGHRSHAYDYVYYIWRGSEVGVNRRAYLIDEVVQHHLIERIRATFDPARLDDAARDRVDTSRDTIRTLEETLHSLERQRVEAAEAASRYHDPRLVADIENRYIAIADEIDRVQSLLYKARTTAQGTAALYPLRDRLIWALENWDRLTWDERRGVIEQLINRVEIETGERKGMRVTLRITWYDDEETETWFVIGKGKTRYTYADQLTIRAMLLREATIAEYKEAFPTRTWDDMRHFIKRTYDTDGGDVLLWH